MLSRWFRTWYGRALSLPIDAFQRLGVTPNAVSIAGLLAHIAAGLLFALNLAPWGLAGLLVGQVLDTLDGELARQCCQDLRFGGFLDSVCDHLGDLAVYLGLLWRILGLNNHTAIILVFVAMFGSVFGSHVRSRAGMAGIDTKRVGIFTRFERTLVLAIGILLNQLTIALWVLAVFNNFSALQRILHAARVARGKPGIAQG